jgi:hypothetical protein
VRHLLQWRFGKLPYGLEARLEQLTADQLSPLVDKALEVSSLQDFLAALG